MYTRGLRIYRKYRVLQLLKSNPWYKTVQLWWGLLWQIMKSIQVRFICMPWKKLLCLKIIYLTVTEGSFQATACRCGKSLLEIPPSRSKINTDINPLPITFFGGFFFLSLSDEMEVSFFIAWANSSYLFHISCSWSTFDFWREFASHLCLSVCRKLFYSLK